ncbi:protein SHQ1 homolog [Episyrphus balteatus]|uniref:protein SHQ1 homolog n=1 Tax=Episyrphus balteatus TaxID=286459 RepID=UPI002485CBCA|nr:protein SHQ1 homolog [Episyrphus balteatus]
MNIANIDYKFNENVCEFKIPITKKSQNVTNCDIFVKESSFILVSDVDIKRFECPRRFDLMDMKNIPINFNTEQCEYTCTLPCYPDETKVNKIEKGEMDKKNPRNVETEETSLNQFARITESCILSVDGKVSEIQSDFPYGFSGRYRGKPKYHEDDLSHICRITDPSQFSSIKRTIQRESDEAKDFCPDQYKLNFVELQIPEGHDNPIKYTIPFDDFKLTQEEECILEKIRVKHIPIDIEPDQVNIDCGLVSILLGICYDTRVTSNEPTCVSPWTRSILSSALSYFERFENLTPVVESFLRRSLIYPIYRNYDLSRLCVQDTVEALQRGKPWILKQLLVTYNWFCDITADFDRKPLNKYFIKHYIWYIDTITDKEHLQMLSRNLKNVLLDTTKKHLRLGLGEIETELLKELIEDIHLTTSSESEGDVNSSSEESGSDSESESESETDDSNDEGDSGSVIEKKI